MNSSAIPTVAKRAYATRTPRVEALLARPFAPRYAPGMIQPRAAPQSQAEIGRLLDIMARLRAPAGGCPWDVVQTFATIAPYTIEEAYEVADAATRADLPALCSELGDLLFQVVYHSRMAEEAEAFTFADVTQSIADKMVRRHPHVFGAQSARDAAAHTDDWETQKATERQASDQQGALASVALALPALTRADKLTRRAARVGFDWPDAESVLAKLDEEVAELRAELPAADPDRLEDELGDMLFVLANLARKLNLDPEAALARANAKFTRRFNAVEHLLAADGTTPMEAGLQKMEAAWQQVKRQEGSISQDLGGASLPAQTPINYEDEALS